MAKLFFVVVTIVLPITFFVYALIRRRGGPFLLGVLAFVISQLLIRIPLLNYVASHSTTYQFWSMTKPFVILFLLALTAGLAEELARWLFMHLLLKRLTVKNGIIFGLGHGGVEALLIVGVPMLSSAVFIVQPQLVMLSGLERLCAMIIHVCLSLYVLISVQKRAFRYCSYAIGIHTFINFTSGYLAKTQSLIIVEVVLALLTCILVAYTVQIVRRNRKNEKMEYNYM